MAKFSLHIIVARPPVWQRCADAFGEGNVNRPGVIFAYGEAIYNPAGVHIPKHIMAHEAVHGERQVAYEGGPDAWWDRYLVDREFRLAEELLAHQAEYKALVKRHGHSPHDLRTIAHKLASPLYGAIIRPEEAKHAILTGAMP